MSTSVKSTTPNDDVPLLQPVEISSNLPPRPPKPDEFIQLYLWPNWRDSIKIIKEKFPEMKATMLRTKCGYLEQKWLYNLNKIAKRSKILKEAINSNIKILAADMSPDFNLSVPADTITSGPVPTKTQNSGAAPDTSAIKLPAEAISHVQLLPGVPFKDTPASDDKQNSGAAPDVLTTSNTPDTSSLAPAEKHHSDAAPANPAIKLPTNDILSDPIRTYVSPWLERDKEREKEREECDRTRY